MTILLKGNIVIDGQISIHFKCRSVLVRIVLPSSLSIWVSENTSLSPPPYFFSFHSSFLSRLFLYFLCYIVFNVNFVPNVNYRSFVFVKCLRLMQIALCGGRGSRRDSQSTMMIPPGCWSFKVLEIGWPS